MKFAHTIILAFLFTMAIGTVFGTYYSYQSATEILKEEVYVHLETTAHSRTNHIIDIFKTTRDQMRIQTARRVSKDNLLNINNGIDIEESKKELQESIDELNDMTNMFYEAKILDKNGIIVASTYKEEIGGDLSDNEFCIQAMEEELFMSDAYIHNNVEVICFARAILNDDNESIGVFLIYQAFDQKLNAREGVEYGIGINAITLDRTGLGETGEIYLLNKDGFVITPLRSGEDVILKQKVDTENSRHCFMHATYPDEEIEKRHVEEGIIIFQDHRGVKFIGTHVYIPETQWCLLVEIGEEEALGVQRKALLKSALISTIILFVIVTIVGFIVAKMITKPIEKLKEGTEIIGKGNLNHRIDINSGNEIGELAVAFNNMASDLSKSRKEIAEYSGGLENKVQEKTKELQSRVDELEKFHKLTVRRELRMIELKKKIKELKKKKQ